MASVPERVLALLTELPDVYLGGVLTLGLHAFPREDGSHRTAAVWFLATDRRAFLASATEEGEQWIVGTGDRSKVDLQKGWTRDTLTLEQWRLEVAKASRGAVWDLVKRWRESGVAAAAWPQTAAPRRIGRVARGAVGLPPWWAANVSAEPGETWLFAMRTGSTQPFSGLDGSVVQHPVWLGVSDVGQVLAAEGPTGQFWVQRLPGRIERIARPGRDRLLAGPRELVGALTSDVDAIRVDALSRPEGQAGRWAAAARTALTEEEIPRALELWSEAASLGHTEAAWQDLARLLLALDQPALAASALALGLDAESPLHESITAWESGSSALRRALAQQEVLWVAVRATLAPWLDGLAPAEGWPGYPWPAQGPRECWSAACVLAGRHPEAATLWQGGGDTPRVREALAAIASLEADPAAPQRWREAALAWRAAGEPAQARAALEAAIDQGAEGADHWLAAAWSWEDGDPLGAEREWTEALTLDPGGTSAASVTLPAAAERALGAHAARTGAWDAAAEALVRLLEVEPGDDGVRRTLVRWLEGPLGRPAEAAELMVRTEARRAEGELAEPEDRARWQRFIEIARLFASAGETEAALEALQEAVGGDFLQGDAIAAALRVPGCPVPEPLAGWWRHLHDLLAGGDTGSPLSPATSFTAEELDRLHPAGTGWLAEIRRGLDPSEPPDMSQITRGLERLRAEEHPVAHGALTEACACLGMEPPDAFLYRGEGSWGASGWPTEPPVLLVGYAHLREGSPHQVDGRGLAFLLTVECAHLRCDHPVLSFDQTLVGTSQSVYTAFGRYAGTAETVVDLVTLLPGVDQLKKLQTIIGLSRRVFTARSVLDKGSALAKPVVSWLGLGGGGAESTGIGRENLTGTALQFRMQADRVGLLAVGDLRVAVDAILAASTAGNALRERVSREGLAPLLADLDQGPGPEETLRITALLEFAARELPRPE